MSLDVSKYASKSLIPRYIKSERKIESKILLTQPKVYEKIPLHQNFPKQDNINVLFPRHTDVQLRLSPISEEGEINQNSKRDLMSVVITTVMNLALGKPVPRNDVESTLTYLK